MRAFEGELDYVYTVLRRHGAAEADIEDLAQDVFLVLWRRWSDYQPDRPLRPWLAGIAFRLTRKHLIRRRREVVGVEREVRDEAPLPDERVASTRTKDLARRALEQLPERHRTALTLHELDDIPMRALADLWGVPLFTAYTRVRAARLAFGKVLEALQGTSHRGTPSSPSAVLASSRTVGRAPTETRRRLQARLRALALLPSARWPRPPLDSDGPIDSPVPGRVAPRLPWVGMIGAVVLLGILVVTWPSRHRAGEQARVAAALPGAAATAPRRLRPPILLTAPVERAPATAQTSTPLSPATALARGLVGYWRFDEGPGSAVAHDLSGNRNDCSFRHLDARRSWTDGQKGTGLNFGRAGRLECPAFQLHTGPRDELTVAIWIKAAHLGPHHRTVLVRPLGSARGQHFGIGFAGDHLMVRSHPYRIALDHPFPTPAGRWVHVAFTRAADGTATLFIAGAPVASSKTRPHSPVDVTGPLIIGSTEVPREGGSPAVMRGQYQGAIDDLTIHARALSPEEIAWLAGGEQPGRGEVEGH